MKRFRCFNVSYVGPTQKRGARVKIYDNILKKTKFLNFNHKFFAAEEQAIDYLKNQGFLVLGLEKIKNEFVIICEWKELN